MDTLFKSTIFFALTTITLGDVSHFFVPELNFFQPPPQQQHHAPFLYAPAPSPSVQPPSPPVSSTTEFFLPEIILNRRAKDPQHGNFIPLNHYLPPSMGNGHPTVQQGQNPSQTYLPPKPNQPIIVSDDPSDFQGYDYKEPSSTIRPNDEEPILQFPAGLLPPIPDMSISVGGVKTTTKSPNQGYFYETPGTSNQDYPSVFQDSGNANGNNHVRLHVKDMRCLENQNGFFRAVLRVESFLASTPTLENNSNDPKCVVNLSRNFLLVTVEAEDFQKCGVHYCGKELCVRLRFPSIRGIRTSSDSLLSLRCKTQSRVAAKTHSLKVGISNDIQARNSDVYAHGGTQNEFRTQIELLRKSSNGFSKKLEPNDVVQLGEELLLRAHVGHGDGWNFTKLTDVNLQLISAKGDLTRSANLITPNGCVNPSMRSVCPQTPVFEPPLGHRLLFKAVMFQEMQSGEEMVLSMKITGCLEQNDCQTNLQECNSGNFNRHKRNAQNDSTNFSEFPRISFRVKMPLEKDSNSEKSFDMMEPSVRAVAQHGIVVVTLLFVGLLCSLGLIIYCVAKK